MVSAVDIFVDYGVGVCVDLSVVVYVVLSCGVVGVL